MTRSWIGTAHDYGRPLIVDLDYDDANLDLTADINTGTPVVFIMTPRRATTPVINRAPATVLASPAPRIVRVRYDWVPPQLDTPGKYSGQFEAALTGGAVTGPSFGHVNIVVDVDLG